MEILPYQDFILLLPILFTALGALVILLLEVFLKTDWPRGGVAGTFLMLAFAFTEMNFGQAEVGKVVCYGLLYMDLFSLFLTALILVASLLALLLSYNRIGEEGIETPAEYYSLFLMCTSGALILASAAELITLFIGLEVMSIALYCLCASGISIKRCAESALKYFFLGSFSSAFLLYGIALVYGLTGTMHLDEIAFELNNVDGRILAFAVGLMLVGLFFKIAVVPFHFWAPDVYEGAPTPVTAYMACVVKAAAVAIALRVLWTAFNVDGLIELWSAVIWFISIVTMVLGNLIALRQRSVKRMLAYSSIAHAGYILVGFLAQGAEYGGGSAILYYLIAYTLMTLGAFGVLMAVCSKNANEKDPDDITRFNHLGVKNPFLAVMMTLFLLSLAGLPPGMIGLLGKFYLFNAAIKAGYVGLAVVGVLCSAISCYYYLRVIVAMYFLPEGQEESPAVEKPDFSVAWALKLCALGVLLFGIFPSLIHSSAVWVMSGF